MKTDQRPHIDARHGAAEAAPCPTVLAVALSKTALSQMPRHVLAPGAIVTLSTLADLRTTVLAGTRAPDLILAPLTARGFDAMDLLGALSAARFAGRVLVLTPHVPDVPLVRADVLAQAPRLNVDVIALDGSSALHLL